MTSPTFIVVLDFSVAAADRSAAVSALRTEQPSVRSMSGCVGFRVFPSIENDTDITVLHEWASQDDFDAYLASDMFARAGETVRPMMVASPSSRRFRTELVDTVV